MGRLFRKGVLPLCVVLFLLLSHIAVVNADDDDETLEDMATNESRMGNEDGNEPQTTTANNEVHEPLNVTGEGKHNITLKNGTNLLRIQALPSFLESPFQALIAAPELFATLQFEMNDAKCQVTSEDCSIVPLHVLDNKTAVTSTGKARGCVKMSPKIDSVRCELGSPFGPHGMAIELKKTTTCAVTLTLDRSAAPRRLIQLSVGAALVIFAGPLGHNLAFYYASGSLLSVLALSLIIAALTLREVNRRTSTFWTLVAGSITTLTGWFSWQTLFPNLDTQDFVAYVWQTALWRQQESLPSIILYSITLISFIIIYWYGPPRPRTLDTLSLVFKLVGAAFVATAVTDVVVGLSLAVLVLAFGEQLSGIGNDEKLAEPAYQPTNGGAPAALTASESSLLEAPTSPTSQAVPSKKTRKSGIFGSFIMLSPWRQASPAHPLLVKDLREHVMNSTGINRLRITRALPKERRKAVERLLDGEDLNEDEFDYVSDAYIGILSDSEDGAHSQSQDKRRVVRIRKKKATKAVSAKKSKAQNKRAEGQARRVAGAQLLSDDDGEDLPHEKGHAPGRRIHGTLRTSSSGSEDDDLADEEVPPQEENDGVVEVEMVDDEDEEDDTREKTCEEVHSESQSEDASEEEASTSESDVPPLVLRALRTPNRQSLPTGQVSHSIRPQLRSATRSPAPSARSAAGSSARPARSAPRVSRRSISPATSTAQSEAPSYTREALEAMTDAELNKTHFKVTHKRIPVTPQTRKMVVDRILKA